MNSHGVIELGNTIHNLEMNKPKGLRIVGGNEPRLKGYFDKLVFIKEILDSIILNGDFDAYCYGCDKFVRFSGQYVYSYDLKTDVFRYTCPACTQYHITNDVFPEDTTLFINYNKERIGYNV